MHISTTKTKMLAKVQLWCLVEVILEAFTPQAIKSIQEHKRNFQTSFLYIKPEVSANKISETHDTCPTI